LPHKEIEVLSAKVYRVLDCETYRSSRCESRL